MAAIDTPDVVCDSVHRRRAMLAVLRIGGPIAAVGFFVFAGLLLYLEKGDVAVEQSSRDLVALGVAVSFFGYFVVWGVVGAVLSLRNGRMEKRLASSGVAGRAVVVRAKQTGGSVNDQPELELLLRVQLPERTPYLALHCQVIDQLFLSRVAPDRSVPIVADPAFPAWMQIDASRWETES